MEQEHDLWLDDDLTAVESHVWAALERGSPFHWPSISTIDPAWGPTTCTVVLRSVDRATRSLVFHTDLRSRKIVNLRANARLAWHFFDSERVQIRARAVAVLHTDDAFADKEWSRLSPGSQRTYCATDPGAARPSPDTGLPAGWFERALTASEVARGRQNFCAVVTRALEIELLYLGSAGHRRARFAYGEEGVEATWLVP